LARTGSSRYGWGFQLALEDETEDGGRAQVDQLELIKSYVSFAVHAVRARLWIAALAFVTVVVIAEVALAVWPRSYHSESTIVFRRGGALDAGDENPFVGAGPIVMRRENLEKIIRDNKLADRWLADKPPLRRFKDWAYKVIGRPPTSIKDLETQLLWSLESSLWVDGTNTTLTFGMDWGNPQVAAAVVTAAQGKFLEARRIAEISQIEEKMAILDGHSTAVRKEIEQIADQLRGLRREKVSEIEKAAAEKATARANAAAAASANAAAALARPRATVDLGAPSEAELLRQQAQVDALREDLEVKKRTLAQLKDGQTQKMMAAKVQLAELLTRFTRAHPEVRRAESTIEMLTAGSPEVQRAEAEVAELEARLKSPGSAVKTGQLASSGGGFRRRPDAPQVANEALPADILKLLEPGSDIDPAVTVQLEGAISKYASLRDGVRTASVDLNTAEAAFNHRYKIVAPADAPNAPSSPDAKKFHIGGILGALLLALLLPILAELRTGIIRERWQVYQVRLPVLAELKLPPKRST